MGLAEAHPRARPRGRRVLAVHLADDHLELPDGARRALLRTEDVDIDSLDPGRRTALLAGFGRLCRTADAPFQLCVRVRPETGAAALRGTGGAAPRSDPGFTRDTTVVLEATAGAPDLLATRVNWATGCLRSGGLAVERLRGAALRARLCDGLDLGPRRSAGGEPPDPPPAAGGAPRAPDEALLPDLSNGVRCLTARGGFAAGVVLTSLPGTAVDPGWLRPVLMVPTECDIAIHLSPLATAAALQRLRRRLRELHADRLIDIDAGRLGDARVDAGLAAAVALQERLVRNEARALCLSVAVLVRAADRPALRRALERVGEAFDTCLAGSRQSHLEHLGVLLSTAPLGLNPAGVPKLVDSVAATSCLPWVETACDDQDGYPLGQAAGSGRRVRLAPFDTSRHSNANVVILAASGHGKTHAATQLCRDAGGRGVPSIVIDPEGEYEEVIAGLGGTYLRLHGGDGDDVALNLLDQAAGRGPAGVSEAATAVVALAGLLCGGLDAGERAQVDLATRAVLDEARRSAGAPTLGDCVPLLAQASPRVAPVLARFCAGPLGRVFDRPSTPLPLHASVGFGLRDLPAELVPPATLILAEWLWATIRRQPRRRHLVFDEAGLLGQHAALRTLLVQLARRCRKYDTSLVVVTQNASDLLRSEDGVVVLTNPSIALLGAHRGAELQRIQTAFSLTDGQRQLLESAGRGEFLLLAGNRRLAVRVRSGAAPDS